MKDIFDEYDGIEVDENLQNQLGDKIIKFLNENGLKSLKIIFE